VRMKRLRALEGGPVLAIEPEGAAAASGSGNSWNLDAIAASECRFTGCGVRVALLDTGYDAAHPDFANRRITAHSFTPGWSEPRDGSGHGTHCLGILARIALGAELYVGKVLDDAGEGQGGSLAAGINWSLANRCKVVLLPLGWPVTQPSRFFELVGRRALNAGALLVAAAGNGSHRAQGKVESVNCPACCPSVLAVGAVDADLRIAETSNGGRIDVVAPGVKVHSSFPLPVGAGRKSGTSMAAAHAAGVAALHLEADPALDARALLRRLRNTARRLPFPACDSGAGLVQASIG